MNVRFHPVRRLRGEIEPPADKSISHRAAILGAMNSEPVRITNYLEADDTISTLNAMRALGALVEQRSQEVVIRGVGRTYEERLRIEAELTMSMFMRRDSHTIGAGAFKRGERPVWPHHGL